MPSHRYEQHDLESADQRRLVESGLEAEDSEEEEERREFDEEVVEGSSRTSRSSSRSSRRGTIIKPSRNTLLFAFQLVAALLIVSLILWWIFTPPQQTPANQNFTPEQIHLSLGQTLDSMVLIWATWSREAQTHVRYGLSPDSLHMNITGWSDWYERGDYASPLFHYIIFEKLQENTTYYYQCGDSDQNVWSQIYPFRTLVSGGHPVTIGCIGDLGQTIHSEQTLKGINQLQPELILLVGDLSYADGNHTRWDTWWNLVQNYTTSLPWMFLPGNHENEPVDKKDDFVSYEKRVLMAPGHTLTPSSTSSPTLGLSQPSKGGNFYYSFDYSWVHFIMLSSETAYQVGSAQHEWLENDLKNIQREKTPWVVVSWHRPWYCSNADHQGSGEEMRLSMEHLFQQYNVDFCLNGHAHTYERTHKLMNFQVVDEGVYYFTIGDGGNHQGLSGPWVLPHPQWSAFRADTYGFSTFTVHNQTHLHWKMFRDDDFILIDEIWMVKLS